VGVAGATGRGITGDAERAVPNINNFVYYTTKLSAT
jgi:hypothetical protein